MAKTRNPAKNVWTRAEYALLLRAWQDVAEDDAQGKPSSKSAVVERVYERFIELSNGDCKRTESAMAIQKSVLAFNFNFIVRYNLAHGANAWVSLDPSERAAVYARKRTSSYHFIDLDPSMMQAMADIRSRLEATVVEKSAPKRPKLLKTATARVKAVPRMSASGAASRAIASEHRRSRKSAYRSSSSSNEHESSNESDTSGCETLVRAGTETTKRARRAEDTVRVAKTELASILAVHKKTTRHLESLLASERRRHRLPGADAAPTQV